MLNSIDSLKVGGNRLLSTLPAREHKDLFAELELVSLSFQQVLSKQGEPAEYVYFPLDSIISLVSRMSDGNSVELAMVGNEGASAVHAALGDGSVWYETVVQIPGEALRIEANRLSNRLETNESLSARLVQFLHALSAQMSQVAACNRLHRAEQRLQTWLTMMSHRVNTDEIVLTQEEIANTLGYNRPTIAAALNLLQKKRVIKYSRGRIKVLDLAQLKNGACECCTIMETQYEKIFSQPPRGDFARRSDNQLENVSDQRFLLLNQQRAELLHETQLTIERIRRSCAATELLYKQQSENVMRQYEQLRQLSNPN